MITVIKREKKPHPKGVPHDVGFGVQKVSVRQYKGHQIEVMISHSYTFKTGYEYEVLVTRGSLVHDFLAGFRSQRAAVEAAHHEIDDRCVLEASQAQRSNRGRFKVWGPSVKVRRKPPKPARRPR